MNPYFAYGSNMDVVQMKERCPNATLLGRAVLKNYRLSFTIFSPLRHCGCADITPAEGEEVWGLLYAMTPDDLERLDRYEGHPTNYKRSRILVMDAAGKKVVTETYQVVNKAEHHVEPSAEYLGKLVRAARDFDFPPSYRSFLDSIPVQSSRRKT